MIVLDERIRQRREVFKFYQQHLSALQGVTFLNEAKNSFSNRWLTTILIDPKTAKSTREQVRLAFDKENIETRPLWKPMHMQPVFKQFPAYTNGVSERLFNDGLCLPSGSNLTEQQLERIIKFLKMYL
jgi:dTDP-4-amino-4,6-dideoxygalactose transaminase